MLSKIETDTYTFARTMEGLILDKCNFTSDETCFKSSFHTCDSVLPSTTCPGNEYTIRKCGTGKEGGCGGLFDFTSSVVSVAPGTDVDRTKDGVCSTLRAEKYMINTTESEKSYWEGFGVLSPTLYYGTDDGVFRMFPGNPGTCPGGFNSYDPRLRPWYIAASSGPKDVILILDTSRSMVEYGRMSIMKEAAKRVVNTLGVSDYFAVIEFDNTATNIGDDELMIRATKENKLSMVNKINGLKPYGGTNFTSGYDLAFRTFTDAILKDQTSSCHRAILFLSDGIMSDNSVDLLQLITEQRAIYTDNNNDPPVLFTYSFGSNADDSVPRDIACQNDGIWAKIDDGGDLAQSMGAYYKYFAYGLGDETNKNFVAWVEPYEFSTNVGLGTTASAPVYDRTVSPPVLAGVVGMDITFQALQKAFGDIGDSHTAALTKIIQRSGAVCPKLDKMKPCQLESLRKYGSNDEGSQNALCNNCDSTIDPLKAELCSDYASEIWDNELNKGLSFEARTCCTVGEDPLIAKDNENNVCKESSINLGLIIGLGIAGVAIVGFMYLFVRYRRQSRNNNPYISNPTSNNNAMSEVPIASFENDIVVLQHPTSNNNSLTAHVVDAPLASFDNDIIVLSAPPEQPVVAEPVRY